MGEFICLQSRERRTMTCHSGTTKCRKPNEIYEAKYLSILESFGKTILQTLNDTHTHQCGNKFFVQ